MTENELRQKVVDIAKSYIGATKGSSKHLELLSIYNGHLPRARGYAVKPTDDYCATAVSAWFIKAEMADIFPLECGVGEAQKLAAGKGIWVENDAYIPKAGDAILYDWQDSGSGDNGGWPDHIMLVSSCENNTIRCVNPNDSNKAISDYSITVNSKYIRGFITPDFASIATKEPEKRYYKTITELNMRNDAGVINKIVITLPSNATVEATGNSKEVLLSTWLEIVYNGVRGWSNSKYLVAINKPVVTNDYYVATTMLNMRSDAGVLNKIVKTIPKNGQVSATGNTKTVLGSVWREIVFEGVTGWSNSKYLAKV